MATSGSVDYSVSATNIITDALYLIGALEEGEAITGEHTTAGLRALNLMAKTWMAQGLHRWTKTEGVLFLNPNQVEYDLGPSGDECARGAFGYTLLNGALSALDTAVTVDSTAPGQPLPAMVAADKIGIELADGSIHWDTIDSVDSSTTLTLTTGVSGAASDNAVVYWYTTQIDRPVRLLGARRGSYNGAQVPMELVARDIYMEQPTKYTASLPVLGHYSPQLTNGKLYVWPGSGSVRNLVWFTYERAIEDFDQTTNTPDFPIEWGETLVWNLAVRLGPQYGMKATAKAQALKPMADEMLALLLSFDEDENSVFFQPA